MNRAAPFEGRAVAISISNSPDLRVLGLRQQHLEDAMVEVARHLLALGAVLVYGGDLRKDGFTEILFELVARHRPDVDEQSAKTGIYNVLAWPVHAQMPFDELQRWREDLLGVAELLMLDSTGAPMTFAQRKRLNPQTPSEDELKQGLTAMRREVSARTHARVLLGGQVENFKGVMPGIAEEAILSMREMKPVYLFGGFGGCARDIAEQLGLAPRWEGSRVGSLIEFKKRRNAQMRNGLSRTENEILGRTPHVDQAVTLMLKGMHETWKGRSI